MAEEDNIQDGVDSSVDNSSQDSGINNTDTMNQQTSEFSIPEEYKDKGWTKFFEGKTGDDLKSELFKSYDNSQSMIGKRVEDFLASNDLKQLSNYEEIKQKLSNQLMPEYNVPQEASDYDLSSIAKEVLGEDTTFEEQGISGFENTFKDLGISKEQGQGIMKAYIDYQTQEFHKFTDANELEQNVSEMFKGNQEQRTTCESLIKEFLPQQDIQFIQDTMPNAVVEMFYKVAKGLVDKYDYKENNSAFNQSTMRMSSAERDSEYNRISNELEQLSHRPHTQAEKQELLNQLNALYK